LEKRKKNQKSKNNSNSVKKCEVLAVWQSLALDPFEVPSTWEILIMIMMILFHSISIYAFTRALIRKSFFFFFLFLFFSLKNQSSSQSPHEWHKLRMGSLVSPSLIPWIFF